MRILGTGTEINLELTRLLRDSSSCQIAVAWASIGFEAFDLLVKNSIKIERMVVGTHFYQTHPKFIEKFRTHPKVRFVTETTGVFHPKVYLFENTGLKWECVIGSPNFTNSAVSKNDEMAVLLTCEDHGASAAFNAVRSSIAAYWKKAVVLDADELNAYTEAWGKKQPVLKEVQTEFVTPVVDKAIPHCTWAEYFAVLKQRSRETPDHHDLQDRLRVIQAVQGIFADHPHFSDMDRIQRNKVAGTLHHAHGVIDGINYHWFGSMWGARQFKTVIKEHHENVSLALDAIPATGDVTRADYLEFVRRYRRAFPNGGDGVGTATRLLAMKRPDVFVCLDSKNRRALFKDFGIRGGVDYNGYWDSIIKRILGSPWWNAPAPKSGLEQGVWQARAAFLDCVYYDGTDLSE